MNIGTWRSSFENGEGRELLNRDHECLEGGEWEEGEKKAALRDGDQGRLEVLCWGPEERGPSEGSLKRVQ